MILYNYRYRGPYEYDKFICNTLQLYNDVQKLENKFNKGKYSDLANYRKQLDNLIEQETGTESTLYTVSLIQEMIQ